jgi:hypothetical protein
MDRPTRIGVLELAAAELLESETNGSLRIGVEGRQRDAVVITATGCCVVVGIENGAQVLLSVARLDGCPERGPRVLAARCEATLRRLHGLPDDFVPTVDFDNEANARRFRQRLLS